MSEVIELQKARLGMAVRRGFRNWRSQLKEDFDIDTRCSSLSKKNLLFLVQGKEESNFFLFDLIMHLDDLGSGFEFNALNPKKKMAVMDRYLFLLDRLRFEYMKRLGWLSEYPGERHTLVELILHFDRLEKELQGTPPLLSPDHPGFDKFIRMNPLQREEFIRALIPKALKALEDHSTTL